MLETAAQISGYLLLDKPSGPTSYDLIRWVKPKFRGVKIGHCGTLDPLASGLMILLFGRATKQQDSFMKQDKIYRGTMRLGIKTDSGDTQGATLEVATPPTLSQSQIEAGFKKFTGPLKQMPPMYSAVKKEGKPLYKWAREGKTVERSERAITVHKFDLLANIGQEVEFRVSCSSGTYIRTLVEDVAVQWGTVACLSSLVREAVGPHHLNDSTAGAIMKDLTREQIATLIKPVAL